jgi:G3E family GTPase
MGKAVPIIVLSGFLGSGKTTLLIRMLEYYQQNSKCPAVIMNELGDVNLDGVLVQDDVPMSEMLSGCICCSISGDLGVTIKSLIEDHQPDVIIIESTGVANPIEVLDAVTSASFFSKIDLQCVITVVDIPRLIEQRKKEKGKTFRLMQDQIRCASLLVVNKTDLITAQVQDKGESLVRDWNKHALLVSTVNCEFDLRILEVSGRRLDIHSNEGVVENSHSHNHSHDHSHDHNHQHHSHDHVMVVTHYLKKSVNRMDFEQMIYSLPEQVYRGKGILRFTDTPGQFMFQYSFRALNIFRIEPQGKVKDVTVFIGEHMPEKEIKTALQQLDG